MMLVMDTMFGSVKIITIVVIAPKFPRLLMAPASGNNAPGRREQGDHAD